MKKTILNIALLAGLAFCTTSCFTHQYSVGEGAQTGANEKTKNHYLIYGLAPVKTSDPKAMARNADDYDVKTQHSFVDGLINMLTLGIYTPTTTTVTR